MVKKLKLQERRAVVLSRRSLAACRPLGFWGDQWCPSWIGGQKGDARRDVNCDDWTDPPLREPATLECYRRAHEIALAELDAAMAQDIVGGGGVEIEIRQTEI
jgi:hypothetical protein